MSAHNYTMSKSELLGLQRTICIYWTFEAKGANLPLYL